MPEIPEPPAELLLAPGADVDEPDALMLRTERWEISGLETAAWAMAKLTEANVMIAGIRSKAAEWRDRIATWERDALRPFEASATWLDERLRFFALAERAASPLDKKGEPTVKRIATPLGYVQTRKGGTAIAIIDEDALVAWCKTNLPEAVKTIEKPLLPQLGAATHVTRDDGAVYGKLVHNETGEIVPGCVVEISDATAKVTPA